MALCLIQGPKRPTDVALLNFMLIQHSRGKNASNELLILLLTTNAIMQCFSNRILILK